MVDLTHGEEYTYLVLPGRFIGDKRSSENQLFSYYGDASNNGTCTPCECFMEGSLSEQCDQSGRCRCKGEIGGDKCDVSSSILSSYLYIVFHYNVNHYGGDPYVFSLTQEIVSRSRVPRIFHHIKKHSPTYHCIFLFFK